MSDRRIGIIFHGIGKPGRTLEPGEAPYWIGEDRFHHVLDRIAALPDPGLVRISFDDGNASDHDIALPALLKRGLRADFFVLSGRIGQAGSLTADQVRALDRAGMGVGSHGIAHVKWDMLLPADLSRELAGSRQAITEITGRPVDTAGIPFGSYNARVLRGLRTAGYTAAYSSDGGVMDVSAYLRPRTSIRADTSDADLAMILSGQMLLGRRLRRGVGMAIKRIAG